MTPETDRGVFEMVRPESGRFVRVRRIQWLDMHTAVQAGPDTMPALVSRIATLDGETLPPAAWLAMDYDDIAPVLTEVNRRMQAAGQRKGAG